MKFTATREQILEPVQAVIGVVERKQTMPILANVLLVGEGHATGDHRHGSRSRARGIGRSQRAAAWRDHCAGTQAARDRRALPDKATVTVTLDGDKVKLARVAAGSCCRAWPATEFPVVESVSAQQTLNLPQAELGRLHRPRRIFRWRSRTFATTSTELCSKRTGKCCERLRLTVIVWQLQRRQLTTAGKSVHAQQVIVPRKGILELQRILGNEGEVEITIGSNHIRLEIGDIRFTSKLIDGKFPEYGRVIPASPGKTIVIGPRSVCAALQRTAILSNEKYRGVRVSPRARMP